MKNSKYKRIYRILDEAQTAVQEIFVKKKHNVPRAEPRSSSPLSNDLRKNLNRKNNKKTNH